MKTGWIVEGRDVTSIPVAIPFPFLRHAPFRWTLHVLRGFTRHELAHLVRTATGCTVQTHHRLGFRTTAAWTPGTALA